MRRQQRQAERRRTLLVVIVAVVVGIGLVAAVALPAVLKKDSTSGDTLAAIGVPAADASCDAPTNEAATGNNNHVANGTTVKYAAYPPSSGAHYATPAEFGKKFYTAQDRPKLEELVHNLEHGYTILWYSQDLPQETRTKIEELAGKAAESDKTAGKFIASAWDPSRGALPSGKAVVLAHWGAKEGHRQMCGQLSGAVVESFVTAYPYTDAPEPNGA